MLCVTDLIFFQGVIFNLEHVTTLVYVPLLKIKSTYIEICESSIANLRLVELYSPETVTTPPPDVFNTGYGEESIYTRSRLYPGQN